MTLMSIRLELARDHDYPNGSSTHGYEFVAPLDSEGHIDLEGWRKQRKHCHVWRFWEGEADEYGHLVHTRGRAWAFHYDVAGDPDLDEPGYRFDSHRFVEGEYVSIREQDEELRTFRVVAVRPASQSPLRSRGGAAAS
ncbi:unnamed protein product [Symbiodinium necroappetens]|uniref:Uncharacterized protein n=1 Tax=Symbiodinium necroappetens TaxID=1628268 RepID=A0A812XCJ0_9DINO|nr:unnamed protein product [Symbiodinium necroappetens]